MTNREVTYSKPYSNILGAILLLSGAMLAVPSQAQDSSASSFNLGFGMNYNSGNNYAYPAPYPTPYPYYGGGGYAGGGYVGGGGGGMYPGYPGMPPTGGYPGPMGGGYNFNPGPIARPIGQMYPYLPATQIYGNMGYGAGYGSYPGLGYAPTGSCIPCGAGLQQTPIYPVQGGPALAGSCGGVVGSCGGQSGASNGAYVNNGDSGVQVIDLSGHNEWEKNDTGSIIWGMAMGVGMNSSTVAPIAFPRYDNTSLVNPSFYNTGDRNFDFYARPHTGP